MVLATKSAIEPGAGRGRSLVKALPGPAHQKVIRQGLRIPSAAVVPIPDGRAGCLYGIEASDRTPKPYAWTYDRKPPQSRLTLTSSDISVRINDI